MKRAPSELRMRVASNVRARFAVERYTVSDLGIALNVCDATARSRLKGKSPFRVDEIERVADMLDTSVLSLFLKDGVSA